MPRDITYTVYKFEELSDTAKEKAREWFRSGNFNDTFWSEYSIEEAVREGEFMGIEFKRRNQKWTSSDGKRSGVDTSPCILWSGFSSQGDGACFEGTWRARDVKADKVADGWGPDPATTKIKRIAAVFAEIAKEYPEASFTVKHRGHYYHEHCTEFDFESGADCCDPDQLERYRMAEDDPEDPDAMPRDRMAQDFPEDELKEAAKDFMRWIYRQLENEFKYQNSDECVDENIRINEFEFEEDGSINN